MSASRWLRANSERYLLRDAQRRLSRASPLARPPAGSRRPDELFWTLVFVPVYRALPWGLRRRVMHLIPGSHRRRWTPQPARHDPAV